MKKLILFLLLLLPAVFMHEKGICQNAPLTQKVLMLERTMNYSGDLKVKKRKFRQGQGVKIELADKYKVRGKITQLTDSTISVGKIRAIKTTDIHKICSHTVPYFAIGGGLVLAGMATVVYSLAAGSYLGMIGVIPAEVGQVFLYIGLVDMLTKTYFSVDKGWKIYVAEIPVKQKTVKQKPVYIIK